MPIIVIVSTSPIPAVVAAIASAVVIATRMLFTHVTSPEAFYRSVVPVPVTALPTMGKATTISKARIVVPVYMTAETVATVIPGTCAYEHPI